MNLDQKRLLETILNSLPSGSGGINAQKFRAKNHQYLSELDDLERKNYIENNDGHYSVKLRALPELDKSGSKASHILFLCDLIFKSLHRFYLDRTGETITLNELAKLTDIPRTDINRAFPYLLQSPIFAGRTTNFEDDAATVTPGEQMLRYNSFRDVIDQYASMSNSLSTHFTDHIFETTDNPFKVHDYINQSRISEVETLDSSEFDFVRLVRICKELNSNARNDNYLALASLIRMLLDHVPPIFGFNTFKEVSANYQSGKSLKASLKNLENSSRNISDGILHQKIRRKETLPTLNQVNFSPDIDVLLGEIIRVTKER
jgi:hypothetical protein